MPQPLNYRNAKAPPHASLPRRQARAVVPIEFDTLLTRSDDHPAVRAVEAALRRAKIESHASDDGERHGRLVELFVRASDHQRAADVASALFARRKKLKSYPRIEMPDDRSSSLSALDLTPYMDW